MTHYNDEFRDLLSNRVVRFKFITKEGTPHEEVVGTTNLRLIPKIHHPKTNRPSSDEVITYFDLSKRGWRCVKLGRDFLVLNTRKTVPKELK